MLVIGQQNTKEEARAKKGKRCLGRDSFASGATDSMLEL